MPNLSNADFNTNVHEKRSNAVHPGLYPGGVDDKLASVYEGAKRDKVKNPSNSGPRPNLGSMPERAVHLVRISESDSSSQGQGSDSSPIQQPMPLVYQRAHSSHLEADMANDVDVGNQPEVENMRETPTAHEKTSITESQNAVESQASSDPFPSVPHQQVRELHPIPATEKLNDGDNSMVANSNRRVVAILRAWPHNGDTHQSTPREEENKQTRKAPQNQAMPQPELMDSLRAAMGDSHM
jgi:hypothetical protein